MMFATPTPTSAQPMMAIAGRPTSRARARPNAATALEPRNTRGGPSHPTRASPLNRPAAIASEKAANPIAATAGLEPSVSCKYTALQSAIAPSAISPSNARIPRASNAPDGRATTVSAGLSTDRGQGDDRRHANMSRVAYARSHRAACGQGTSDAAKTEKRVERRHDWPADALLHLC